MTSRQTLAAARFLHRQLLLCLLVAAPLASAMGEADPPEEPAIAQSRTPPALDFLLYLARWDAQDTGWLELLEDAARKSAGAQNGEDDDQ
jgi:hypothetical protein